MSESVQNAVDNREEKPTLSLILPCYNEANSIRATVSHLVERFAEQGFPLELVLVDNGSSDDTGEIIDQLIAEGYPVVKSVVPVNQGYSHGILRGIPYAHGRLVGFMCADEQVDAPDVVKLYEMAAVATTPKLFKVRRRFRLEGPFRRIVSILYNVITRILFGNLGSMDLNANPKILPREYLDRMALVSKDWFLDAEVMLKAKALGLQVYEMNVLSQMRAEGSSHVRPTTCWEFIVNLVKYRFRPIRVLPPPDPAKTPSTALREETLKEKPQEAPKAGAAAGRLTHRQ